MPAPLRNDAGVHVWDQRSIANLFLEQHLAIAGSYPSLPWLSRILFIFETQRLARLGAPTMYGFFEAWRRGPVQPVVASEFAEFGVKPISRPGLARPPFKISRLPDRCDDAGIIAHARTLTTGHVHSPQWLLDGICTAPRSAWATIVQEAQHRCILGMRIQHSLMLECARTMMCAVRQPKGFRLMPDEQFGSNAERKRGHISAINNRTWRKN